MKPVCFIIFITFTLAQIEPFPYENLVNFAPSSGSYSNVRVGNDNRAIIIFNDANAILIVQCSNPFCTERSYSSLPVTGDADRFIFMRLNPETGFPLISYSDREKRQLKYVYCLDVMCFESIETVIMTRDQFDQVPTYSNFDFLKNQFGDGIGVMLTFTVDGRGLYYVYCEDLACKDVSKPSLVAQGKRNGQFPSVASFDFYPVFVYYNEDTGSLMMTVCTVDRYCTQAVQNQFIDYNQVDDIGRYVTMKECGGWYTITYTDQSTGWLKYARCSVGMKMTTWSIGCSRPVYVDIVGLSAEGVWPSMTCSPDFNDHYPIFSYFNATSDVVGTLKLAICHDMECKSPSTYAVKEGGPGFGRYSSIALRINEIDQTAVHISFLDPNDSSAMMMTLSQTKAPTDNQFIE